MNIFGGSDDLTREKAVHYLKPVAWQTRSYLLFFARTKPFLLSTLEMTLTSDSSFFSGFYTMPLERLNMPVRIRFNTFSPTSYPLHIHFTIPFLLSRNNPILNRIISLHTGLYQRSIKMTRSPGDRSGDRRDDFAISYATCLECGLCI